MMPGTFHQQDSLALAADNMARTTEVRHFFAKIPVFVPRPANEFKYLPQFSGAKQKMSVVARCAF